jgi:DNA invertase Pin-like site-specific DNA recombinase
MSAKTIDGYVRVSKVRGREGDSFISPDVQEERIRAWSKANGYRVGEMHVELDQSGARADRPKLMRALDRVESGATGGVVVARLDRFGRSLVDSLSAIERIREAGGTFASVADGFDMSTPTGEMVATMLLAFAQLELSRIRDGFDEARARAVKRGIHPSPVPPFGYDRPEDEDGHITGPLEPNPVTGPLVTEVYMRRAGGASWPELCRFLQERGALGAYGHEHWTPRALKTMVRNRVYLGEARHGEHVNENAHPPLIDPVTWRRAQRNGSVSPARSEHAPALLAGLARCAGCRYGMSTYYHRGTRQYRCHCHYPAGSCPEPAYISASSAIEEYVTERFFDAIGTMTAEAVADGGALADLERTVAEAQEALTVYRDDPRIISTLGPDGFAAGLEARKATLDAAMDALADARRALDIPATLPPAELRALWPSLDVIEHRRLLALAIDAVFVRRGRGRYGSLDSFVWIAWRGEAPEVPRRGGRPTALLAPVAYPWDNVPAAAGLVLSQ